MALAGTVGLGCASSLSDPADRLDGGSNAGRFAAAFFAQAGCQSNVSMVVSWSCVRFSVTSLMKLAQTTFGGGRVQKPFLTVRRTQNQRAGPSWPSLEHR